MLVSLYKLIQYKSIYQIRIKIMTSKINDIDYKFLNSALDTMFESDNFKIIDDNLLIKNDFKFYYKKHYFGSNFNKIFSEYLMNEILVSLAQYLENNKKRNVTKKIFVKAMNKDSHLLYLLSPILDILDNCKNTKGYGFAMHKFIRHSSNPSIGFYSPEKISTQDAKIDSVHSFKLSIRTLFNKFTSIDLSDSIVEIIYYCIFFSLDKLATVYKSYFDYIGYNDIGNYFKRVNICINNIFSDEMANLFMENLKIFLIATRKNPTLL